MAWDEPDLLQNVKRVSPWLVELVSNMPTIHLSPFSPPRKKLRLPQHPEFALDGQLPMPIFPGNHLLGPSSPFGCLPDNTPAGMQGARHAQYGLSLSDLHFNKLQSGLFPVGLQPLDHAAMPTRHFSYPIIHKPSSSDNVSCLLTMGNCAQSPKKTIKSKEPQFVLFGKPILTEQQISSCSGDTISPVRTGNSSSDGNADKMGNTSDGSGSALNLQGAQEPSSCEGFEANLETGHCKVFMETEDVGRSLDLSLLGSYEELYGKLADMFGIGTSEVLNHVLYRDVTGAARQLGDETFR